MDLAQKEISNASTLTTKNKLVRRSFIPVSVEILTDSRA